jgi:hypothetical protein
MHTIPQNVTSYEDKIVGIFVGRQFIYLGVGGLTAFILLSTGGGAAVIFRFVLAIGVVALAAALALLKINDRNFDIWLLGFIKAVLGPTEWAWQKQEPLMTVLAAPDRTLSAATLAKPQQAKEDTTQFNRQRKDAFKSYISGSSKDLDNDEQAFLQQLNFSEPIPQGSAITLSSHSAAPPMLTPSNPQKATPPSPQPPPPPVAALPAAKPLAALARSTARPAFTFEVGGKQQSVSLLHNQTTNRSLSRQLLSSGVVPVPVRGELRLNLAPSYQQELTNLIGFAPETGKAAVYLAAGSLPPTPPTVHTDSQPTPASSPLIDHTVARPEPTTEDVMNIKMQAASDWHTNSTDNRRKLQIEGAANSPANQAMPVASEPAPAAPPATTPASDPALEPATPQLAPSSPPAPVPEPDAEEEQLRQQLSTFEELAKRAQAQLEEERKGRQELEAELNKQQSDTALLTQHYQEELTRIQQRSQEAASQSHQAQQQLEALQQQAQQAPGQVDQAEVDQQKSLVEKLRQEEQRSASFARELLQKMQQSSAAPATSPTTALVTPAPSAVQQPLAVSPDHLPSLTTEPNVINGFVFGADGQFVEGAVVVIKDDSGEAKRALKSNKLGQFLVTTPLANGHYMVEVDKKGLQIDTINIELKGRPILPLVIQAKAAA